MNSSNKSSKDQLMSQINMPYIPSRNFEHGPKLILPSDWSEKEVTIWLRESNIDTKIAVAMEGFDGKMLRQLYQMKKDSPNSFYSYLKEVTTCLKTTIHFTLKIDQLFYPYADDMSFLSPFQK